MSAEDLTECIDRYVPVEAFAQYVNAFLADLSDEPFFEREEAEHKSERTLCCKLEQLLSALGEERRGEDSFGVYLLETATDVATQVARSRYSVRTTLREQKLKYSCYEFGVSVISEDFKKLHNLSEERARETSSSIIYMLRTVCDQLVARGYSLSMSSVQQRSKARNSTRRNIFD